MKKLQEIILDKHFFCQHYSIDIMSNYNWIPNQAKTSAYLSERIEYLEKQNKNLKTQLDRVNTKTKLNRNIIEMQESRILGFRKTNDHLLSENKFSERRN